MTGNSTVKIFYLDTQQLGLGFYTSDIEKKSGNSCCIFNFKNDFNSWITSLKNKLLEQNRNNFGVTNYSLTNYLNAQLSFKSIFTFTDIASFRYRKTVTVTAIRSVLEMPERIIFTFDSTEIIAELSPKGCRKCALQIMTSNF